MMSRYLLVLAMLFSITGTTMWGGQAYADESLIREMESLRNSLAPSDNSRSTLTRRLADLYFENAVKLEKDIVLKGLEGKEGEVEQKKRKALRYYREAITGNNGKYIAPKGELKSLLQFQIARIHKHLMDEKAALANFESVFSDENAPAHLKKESALQIAEMAEEKGQLNRSNKYYAEAGELCKAEETCAYITYRMAWNYFRGDQIPKAVDAIRTVVFDSRGSVKEQVLQDFIVFLASMPGDGSKELAEVEELSKRLKRNELLTNMSEAFFAAGNREAGTNALYYVNQRTNNPYFKVRLLDEFYGFKDWDRFREVLSSLSGADPATFEGIAEKKAKEAKKIIQRVIVQLDADRKANEPVISDLQKTIDLYLNVYPQDDLRQKMIDGWLTAESDETRKMNKLAEWIKQEVVFENKKQQERLRKMRLSLAQKLKNQQEVVNESRELAKLYEVDTEENRKYRFIVAHNHYKREENEQALPMFLSLAQLAETIEQKPDQYAVKSINLALDIYNQDKNYSQIIEVANSWIDHPDLQDDKKLAKEISELVKVKEQAQFEQAVAMGETPEALETFEEYCYSNRFPEKACPNVKVLAVKLNNQDSLVKILNHKSDEKALMVEYELMGDFAKAAPLLEKHVLKKSQKIEDYLKVTLFYELAQDTANRDRILEQLKAKLKRQKSIDKKLEPVVFATLRDAGHYDASLLALPWSTSRKMRMVQELENKGMGNQETKNIIAQSEKFMGPEWVRMRLKKLEKLNNLQAQKSFYGARSKQKFQKRVNALNRYVNAAKIVLKEADTKTRVYILERLSGAYFDLADEIVKTPIPEILEEEQKMKFAVALQQMAEPFQQEAVEYNERMQEQLADVDDEQKRDEVLALAKLSVDEFANSMRTPVKEPGPSVAQLNLMEVQSAFEKLQKNPTDREALMELEAYFKENKQPRAASYFKGRLEDTEAQI